MATRPHPQHGYTLIELLLYVAIVSSLLIATVSFFGAMITARVKAQTIAEVNDQGIALMDGITRTIRNATSVSAPSAGASGSSLTLVVPTAGLSPTIFDAGGGVLGYNQDGGSTDESNSNNMNAVKFTAGVSGTVTTLYARVANVAASPNNKAQMAIYSGTSSPSTLLASSTETTLVANSWNAFTIPSTNVTSGQTYWLAYNTNGPTITDNNLRYHAGSANQSMYTSRPYGSWSAGWIGTAQNIEFSMYAAVSTAGGSALQIKEGAAAAIPLTSNDVQVSGLTFNNLTRSGTPGIVQVSFTLSRVNPSGRNEYDYQKTFTSTAEVAW